MKPSALKKLPINKTWIILGVALAVGLLAAFIAQRYISNQIAEIESRDKNRRTINVVVAKDDLGKGTRLDTRNVAVRPIPAEYAHSGAILPEQFERVDGQPLAYAAKRGEAVLWSMLEGKRAPTFSSRIEPGRRAVTVPVDEINSISGMVEPGDIVDLMVSVDHKGRKITVPLLQSVTVLATGQRAANDPASGERRQYTTLTFDTTPVQAHSVIVARETGKLTALLRNPSDKVPVASSRSDIAAVLGLGPETAVAAGTSPVPVLYGGRGKLPDEIPRLGGPAIPVGVDTATVSPAAVAQVLTNTNVAQAAPPSRP